MSLDFTTPCKICAIAASTAAGFVDSTVAALVVGLQPLLVAVGAGLFLHETVVRRQWLGLVLGLAGVALVLANKLGADFELVALLPCVISLLAINLLRWYLASLFWATFVFFSMSMC